METRLLFSSILLSFFLEAYSQDTTKVKVTFLTKNEQTVSIYKEIYSGDIETSGYDMDDYSYQHGSFSIKEFAFNAPSTQFFEREKPLVLIMTDKYSKTQFTVNTAIGNQKWLLTPAGKDYLKSKYFTFGGIGGIMTSVSLFAAAAIIHLYIMDEYKFKIDRDNVFHGGTPQKPKNLGALYILPSITMSVSILTLVRGVKLYRVNAPHVEQLE